MTGDPKC